MKNTFALFVAILIVGILLAYMFSFRVRYDETAIVTTFGHAAAMTDGSSGSVRTKPNLYLRWPWPFQRVHIYSKRLQLIDDERLQQQMTKDDRSIIVRLFMAWRIKDPLKFHKKKLASIKDAERNLRPFLKDAMAILSEYRFDQFVNTDASKLKLDEIEQRALETVNELLIGNGGDEDFGIEVVRVGIQRILLPTNTTDSVFGRMTESRLRMAQKARSKGQAEALAIMSKATSASQRILAFAERSAQKIRAKGDEEAAKSYSVFREHPELAIHLREIQTMIDTLKHNATVFLSADTFTAVRRLTGGLMDVLAAPSSAAGQHGDGGTHGQDN